MITIMAPASKSLSHRMLMAAALAEGESEIAHVLESDDIARTRELLASLGAVFTPAGPGTYRVRGVAGRVGSPAAGTPLSCFVGESGTTCRLITAILAAGQGQFRLHGAGRMHERPMRELTAALEQLGVSFCYEEKDGHLPFVLETSGFDASHLPEDMLDMGADESSQYLSGLLLAAPLSSSGLTIRLAGKKAVSWPYIGLTLDSLERFGIRFTVEELCSAAPERAADNGHPEAAHWRETDWRALREAIPGKLRFRVEPGMYTAGNHMVEGDWSGASYFLAAGAIGPAPVCVEGLNRESLQGDAAILPILKAMGADIKWQGSRVIVSPAHLRGIDVDMGQCPDLAPTVAAVAALAAGPTCISNVAHLRIKESDRLAAPATELAKVGCFVEVLDSGLRVTPPESGPRRPGAGVIFHAHGDHRIAMGMSLLGLPGIGGRKGFAVELDDPACVAKSFPLFWDEWKKVRP
jgi:3-phosphoshikimate 1-carboxyvinyltransferase